MKRIVGLALCVVALPATLTAASISIIPSVGTLGLGAGVDVRALPFVGFRVMGNAGSHSQDLHKQDIDYTGKLKLNNLGGLVDFYPVASGFRISAGVFSNNNKIDLTSKPGQTITVNGIQYPSSAVGNVTGDVRFNKTSPYAGIGWGRTGRGFGLVFDIGVLSQGSPKLRVQANPTNPALVPASFYTNLEAERAKTENDIRNYKYYPVVSLGLSFGF